MCVKRVGIERRRRDFGGKLIIARTARGDDFNGLARAFFFFFIVRVGKFFVFFPRFCFYSLNYNTRAGRRSVHRARVRFTRHVYTSTIYIYIYILSSLSLQRRTRPPAWLLFIPSAIRTILSCTYICARVKTMPNACLRAGVRNRRVFTVF